MWDAADAYGNVPDRFDRHIVFVRPDLFLIYDDLVASEPVPFTWLLHGHETPAIDADSNRIEFHRGDAHLTTDVYASTDLSIRHTDEYSPPVNEGMIDELKLDVPPTNHVYVETEPTRTAAICADASVSQGETEPGVTCEVTDQEVSISRKAFSERYRSKLPTRRLRVRWTNRNGYPFQFDAHRAQVCNPRDHIRGLPRPAQPGESATGPDP